MELQHVNIKIYVDGDLRVEPDEFIKVFHRWTANQSLDALLVDVADYMHVPSGPGIVLVGHDADYALDNAEDRYGLLYNRKAPLDGTNADRIRQAITAANTACDLLEAEFGGRLKFDRQTFELIVNDRALAPNTAETLAACTPDIEDALRGLGHDDATLTHQAEPRKRFGVTVQLSTPLAAAPS